MRNYLRYSSAMMKTKYIAIIPLALLLAGCGDSKKIVNLNLNYVNADATPANGTADIHAQAELAQAASSVNDSLEELSAIQVATHPEVHLGAPVNARALGLAQKASLNWTGPVKPLLKHLAKFGHYKLRVVGKTPAIPIIVAIDANNETLAQMLRDIKYQVSNRATVLLYPRARIIELRYRS